MKSFVINLDKDVDRLKSISSQLESLKIPFERFPAILGTDLPESVIQESVNRFRWACAVGRPVRMGEIGCALSHAGVYRQMIQNGITAAQIFEDDITIDQGFFAQQKAVLGVIDVNRPQVFLYSAHNEDRRDEIVEPSVLRWKSSFFTDAYVITQPAAKVILKKNFPMHVPCDHWGRWARRGLIELYHVFPSSIMQKREEFGSQTSGAGALRVDPFCQPWYLLYKFRRLMGLVIDRGLPL